MSPEEREIDELPTLPWEDPGFRVTIPHDLQIAAGLEARTYRWAQEKLNAIRVHRPDVVPVISRLGNELNGWQVIGTEATGNTRVLFIGSDGRYYALTLGQDRAGSWNVITIVGSSNPRFPINRTKTLQNIRRRNR